MIIKMRRIHEGAIALACLFICGTASFGQSRDLQPTETIWRDVSTDLDATAPGDPWIRPMKFRAVAVDIDRFETALRTAPREFTDKAAAPLRISLPMPDGSWARFDLVESPVMAPALAAQFPEIMTFAGVGVDDPRARLRADVTPQGFHAQVLSPRGAVYIDPVTRGNTEVYASYFKRDFAEQEPFSCGFVDPAVVREKIQPLAPSVAEAGILYTFRTAVATTGEYTAFHGGTVPAGQAAVVTAINRVTGVYENEVSARLELVANNSSLIYTVSATDPYTNGSGVAMLSENQTNIDAVIGDANYDVGHVFSTGGGGVASLGVICFSGSKARGVTGRSSPVGDPFYIDYVSHELGHQFGGLHTFNSPIGSCAGNRSASAAYEPGSGSTIQAYAGICGADDLQPNSDPYFTFKSLDEINALIASQGVCASTTANGNQAPTVDAGIGYVIPMGTPFELTAVGDDADGDPITYCWEQADLSAAATLADGDLGDNPIFRSWPPTSDPVRTFPRLSDLLAFTLAPGEVLPTTTRILNFRVTVRDNNPLGGGTGSDTTTISVDSTIGPFSTRAPGPGTVWNAGDPANITWNVGGTDVLAPFVDLLLSDDGGSTFRWPIAVGVANDGVHGLAVPNIPGADIRIKVRASDNIFFDIGPAITINGTSCPSDISGLGGLPDGSVSVNDLLQLLGDWGETGGVRPIADIAPVPDGDNTVDVQDLLELLGNWGPC